MLIVAGRPLPNFATNSRGRTSKPGLSANSNCKSERRAGIFCCGHGMKYQGIIMTIRFLKVLFVFIIGGLASCGSVSSSGVAEVPGPDHVEFDPARVQTAVFAGGCFWGVEAVFEHTRGVVDARSGYAGGTEGSANYDTVSSGQTGHAESVEVTFDPDKVTYQQLLEIFFKVVHDPTQLNRQGPDEGPQYRSAIFYLNGEQKKAAEEYIARLTESKAYADPVVTQVVPLDRFYPAEEYHQDYARKNPKDAYIVYHDLPKIEYLKKQFPELYVNRR